MKFNYTKPAIAFQNVALSSGISPSCKYTANYNYGDCTIDVGYGETLFGNLTDCTYTPDQYNAGNGCYDLPTEASVIIDS